MARPESLKIAEIPPDSSRRRECPIFGRRCVLLVSGLWGWFTGAVAKPHQIIDTRYSTEEGKQEYLRRLFNEGAPHYDRIGWIGSFGTGHTYRKRALRRGGLKPGLHVLDVACGTGAVTRAILEVLQGSGSVVGVDPSVGMLAQARANVPAEFREARAEALPFPDASFDLLTMGYALRHVEDLHSAFKEYRRVLRPGGRVLLLEITRPEGKASQALARFYFRDFLGWMVRLTGGNRASREMMTYYWETIDACVPPEIILSALRESGFSEVTRHADLGMFSEYRGLKN
jgi:demethylmenaquinone methyltransferase/2-methoxy-6-polyprenyl-1,4-benzoquinol methylase